MTSFACRRQEVSQPSWLIQNICKQCIATITMSRAEVTEVEITSQSCTLLIIFLLLIHSSTRFYLFSSLKKKVFVCFDTLNISACAAFNCVNRPERDRNRKEDERSHISPLS